MEEQNKALVQRRVIYYCREASLSRVTDGYIVSIEGEQERFFINALEAWANFIDTLDARVRQRISEYQNREARQL